MDVSVALVELLLLLSGPVAMLVLPLAFRVVLVATRLTVISGLQADIGHKYSTSGSAHCECTAQLPGQANSQLDAHGG